MRARRFGASRRNLFLLALGVVLSIATLLLAPTRRDGDPLEPTSAPLAGAAAARERLARPDASGGLVEPGPQAARTEAPRSERDRSPFEQKPAERVPLQLRITDERTEEPVPDYEVWHLDGGWQRALTDAAGFVRTQPVAAGILALRLEDRTPSLPYVPVELELEHAPPVTGTARALSVSVPVGPTYALRIVGLPPDAAVADVVATLHTNTDGPVQAGLRPGCPGDESSACDAWVRFSPSARAHDPTCAREHELVLRLEPGWYEGRVDVTQCNGRRPGVLEIVLRPHAKVSVLVRDREGEPLQARIRGTDAFGVERLVETDDDGRGVFDYLPAGVHRVQVETERHATAFQDVVVDGGSFLPLTFDLDGAAVGGDVSGELRFSRSEGGMLPTWPSLVATDGSRRVQLTGGLTFSAGVARFAFHDVPVGDYRLELESSSLFGFEVEPEMIRPPLDRVRVLIRDDVATLTYTLDLRTRAGGKTEEFHSVVVEHAKGTATFHGTDRITFHAPQELAFRWRVRGGGGSTGLSGTSEDFVQEGAARRLERIIDDAP